MDKFFACLQAGYIGIHIVLSKGFCGFPIFIERSILRLWRLLGRAELL